MTQPKFEREPLGLYDQYKSVMRQEGNEPNFYVEASFHRIRFIAVTGHVTSSIALSAEQARALAAELIAAADACEARKAA
jgi:hypothetical protein